MAFLQRGAAVRVRRGVGFCVTSSVPEVVILCCSSSLLVLLRRGHPVVVELVGSLSLDADLMVDSLRRRFCFKVLTMFRVVFLPC